MVQPHKLWLGFQQKVFFLIVLLGDQAVFISRSAQFSVLGNICGIANHGRGTLTTKVILRPSQMLTLLPSFPPPSSKFKMIVNEELPFCLLSGTVVLKPNVKEFTENSAVFEDGTTEEDIDVVLFATGYNFSFPFLEESVRSVIDNNRSLYKCIFPPQLEKPTLAIIGLIQLTGSVMVGSEMQARWVAGVFAGRRWGDLLGWEVWGSLTCCPQSLGRISAPWWPWESVAWQPLSTSCIPVSLLLHTC